MGEDDAPSHADRCYAAHLSMTCSKPDNLLMRRIGRKMWASRLPWSWRDDRVGWNASIASDNRHKYGVRRAR